MNSRAVTVFGICIFSLIPFAMRAQQASGPLSIKQENQFAVTLNAGQFQRTIAGMENKAARFFLKAGYSLTDRLDLFAQAGVTKLELQSGELLFQDKLRPIYGIGVNFRPLLVNTFRTALLINGQLLRFVSRPQAESASTISGSQVTEVDEFKYDWREAVLNLGLVKEWNRVNLYGGVNVRFIQREETRTESLILNENPGAETRTSTTFQSGAIVTPQVGMELLLPSRIILSLEIAANHDSDYVFFVGLSQIGKP